MFVYEELIENIKITYWNQQSFFSNTDQKSHFPLYRWGLCPHTTPQHSFPLLRKWLKSLSTTDVICRPYNATKPSSQVSRPNRIWFMPTLCRSATLPAETTISKWRVIATIRQLLQLPTGGTSAFGGLSKSALVFYTRSFLLQSSLLLVGTVLPHLFETLRYLRLCILLAAYPRCVYYNRIFMDQIHICRLCATGLWHGPPISHSLCMCHRG